VSFFSAPAAAEPPEVKTGVRVVATIRILPGTPSGKAIQMPGAGVAVKIFLDGGEKAVSEGKTDETGALIVALPAGKYRVDAAFQKVVSAKVEVKDGAVSEAKLEYVEARR
jgi:hypothetical protein